MHRFALACALCALVPTAACAQQRQLSEEQRQAVQQRWQTADSNQDGVIDRAEADAGLPRVAKNFDKLDADGDGRLTRDELKTMAERFAQRRRR